MALPRSPGDEVAGLRNAPGEPGGCGAVGPLGGEMMRRVIVLVLVVLGVGFLAIQVVPYGRAHANPAVVSEPQWDSPRTRELAVRACFDCHSNETVWPWYSNVAPVSWLVQQHTEEGRGVLNFSRWDLPQRGARKAAEQVQEGAMPPPYYTPLHASGRLSEGERAELIAGLQATLGQGERGTGRP